MISDDGKELFVYGGAAPMTEAEQQFYDAFRGFPEVPPTLLCQNGEVRPPNCVVDGENTVNIDRHRITNADFFLTEPLHCTFSESS